VIPLKDGHMARTLVIKLGTSILTDQSLALNRERMLEFARCCSRARQQGRRIVLVTSGAVAAGRARLGFPDLPRSIASRQMLAAVGQIRLIQIWEQLFDLYNIQVGQMLLTRADLEDKERFLNARDMLRSMLDYGVVPVINENDAVATNEIRVGDNDNLSALAAILAGADLLLLLTDQPGLFNADPRSHPEAELIAQVTCIDDKIRALAGGSVSGGLGTGGMSTKIQAAEIATRAGIRVIIASGRDPELLEKILAGESAGTCFTPSASPLENRKRWLFGAPPAGDLLIDAGAALALSEKGSSLLPKGITGVSGSFPRGAVVRLITPRQNTLARGVTQYNSEALNLLAGRHSNEIFSLIGYEHGPVAVHRDDLILLGA
jgi:glutamate 5-kinase